MRHSADALDLLDRLSNPTDGQPLLVKNVAKHTSIVRVTERVAALKYHDTFLAWYGHDCTIIDVPLDRHTRSTWERIERFTAARPRGERLLRYLLQPNGDRVLYEPGLRVDPDGVVLNPMLPSRQRRIEGAVDHAIELCREHAATAVAAWDAFEDTPMCNCDRAEPIGPHLMAHVTDPDDLTIPLDLRGEGHRLANLLPPDQVVRTLRKNFTMTLLNHLVPYAVAQADPNYPFPTPRST